MKPEDSILDQALRLMKNALDLIDASGSATDVGAHLDLAIQRLQALLEPTRECPWQTISKVEQAYGDGKAVGVSVK